MTRSMAESASLLRTLTGAGAGIASSVRQTAGSLLPRFREGNLDDRDTDAMRELLPVMWLIASACRARASSVTEPTSREAI